MPKLTPDQLEALKNLVEEKEGCAALLLQMANIVAAMKGQLHRIPVIAGKESEIIYQKLRIEGAQKMLDEILPVLQTKVKKAE